MNDKYKNDLKHYIDTTPVVDMKGFVTLLLADLASKETLYVLNGPNKKQASLPMDYKSRIEQIMYEDNGWGIKFSRLIDIDKYYEHQDEWERELGETINCFLSDSYDDTCKSWHTTYNFEIDTIEIPFTVQEIEDIKGKYDEETLEIMDHFSNLVSDYAFSRKFKIDQREQDRFMNRAREKQYSLSINALREKGIKNPERYLNLR